MRLWWTTFTTVVVIVIVLPVFFNFHSLHFGNGQGDGVEYLMLTARRRRRRAMVRDGVIVGIAVVAGNGVAVVRPLSSLLFRLELFGSVYLRKFGI